MWLLYIVLLPAVIVAISVLYDFVWKAIHEYSHLAALKFTAGKDLVSYKVRLYRHELHGEWVPASLTWETSRHLSYREVAFIAIAPHVIEFFACIAFMASPLFLLGGLDTYPLFFCWASFWFSGIVDLMAALVCGSVHSDLYVYSHCTGTPVWEVKTYGWFAVATTILVCAFFLVLVI